jgi:hypothetical protein
MTGSGYEHIRKKKDKELKSVRREWLAEEDIPYIVLAFKV